MKGRCLAVSWQGHSLKDLTQVGAKTGTVGQTLAFQAHYLFLLLGVIEQHTSSSSMKEKFKGYRRTSEAMEQIHVLTGTGKIPFP